MQTVETLIEQAVAENARRVLNQADYNERYDALATRYETAKDKITRLDQKIAVRIARRDELQRFVSSLNKEAMIDQFSEDMWFALLDHVIVCKDGTLRFAFRDNTEIAV